VCVDTTRYNLSPCKLYCEKQLALIAYTMLLMPTPRFKQWMYVHHVIVSRDSAKLKQSTDRAQTGRNYPMLQAKGSLYPLKLPS